jgi:glutamate-1-semialdehyde 2,1-aminomutase
MNISREELAQRALQLTPGGVHSNVRLEVANQYFSHGAGSRLWDTNGSEYVDYLLGQGPAFLGHAFEPVITAVEAALRRGIVFGAQSDLEVQAAAEVLDAVRWAERVRFGMTGTEAVQAALRVARAHTQKTLFVRFRGHYHGWLDNVLVDATGDAPRRPSDGQLPTAFDDSITIEWNDLDALRTTLQTSMDIAAVIMEPMMLNAGAVAPRPGYLEGVRALCDEYGVVLIFDETITGFRLALGGGAELFGVNPDLAIYGKAMGGGYPAAALAGIEAIMRRFAEGTNHSGTFNANLPACAAVIAAIQHMRTSHVHASVAEVGSVLASSLQTMFHESDLPIVVRGVGQAFHVSFDSSDPVLSYSDLLRQDQRRYHLLVAELRAAGVWVASRGIWYVSAAHSALDVDETLTRVQSALLSFKKKESKRETAEAR